MPFHITARIQCRERLLCGLESQAAGMIQEALIRSDAGLVAYAIMPNHLHIILQQGGRPLSDYMQPLLRRIALAVRRAHGWEGHVFERRYRESACVTPDYLRNAIAYVHLNGLRAGLASSVEAYEWCSHRAFCVNQSRNAQSRMAMEDALRVFAAREGDVLPLCSDNYRAFVQWRMLLDARAADLDSAPEWHPPAPPYTAGGDEHWLRVYAPHVRGEMEHRSSPPRRLDLRDLALLIMRDLDPDMRLADLRSGSSTRRILQVRKKVVVRACAAGYTGRAIS
ncbi:MAG TPA: transposase, partial [Longimicrobiales bacterium]|nr:transposase [Longimicrobiales bacterium]